MLSLLIFHVIHSQVKTLSRIGVCHGLALAANEEPHSRSIVPPPENWKKETKPRGRNKGSLTEKQRKRTVTTTILISRT